MTERIAIVSIAGRFPGAGADLGRFWDRVAGAADCSRDVPHGRWALPPDRCTDPSFTRIPVTVGRAATTTAWV